MISGSLRGGSTNTSLLRTAARLELDGVETELYDGMGGLPHFNPDDDPDGGNPPASVAVLRAKLGRAEALLFSTPEYAGALPGSFKNLLDWSVGGGDTYAMPVAWVNTAGPAAPNGGRDAHDSLRKVLGYTGSEIVEAACARIPVARDAISADGTIADPELTGRIADVVQALAAAARARRDAD